MLARGVVIVAQEVTVLAIAPSLAKAATIGAARAGDASACSAAIAKRTAACGAIDYP